MKWPTKDSTWTRRIQFWRARGRALARSQPSRGAAPSLVAGSTPGGTTSPAVDQAWDEAFLRVESYLRAHHLKSRVQLNALAMRVVTEARALAVDRPLEEPVELAMHVLHLQLGTWFVRAFNEGDWADERFRARGRLALVMTNMSNDWPQHFLVAEGVPSDITSELKECMLQPGPEVRFSNMPPAPLEFPFADGANPAWQTFSQGPFVKGIATWVLIIGLLGVAWVQMH
jgi:hypothetical protein